MGLLLQAAVKYVLGFFFSPSYVTLFFMLYAKTNKGNLFTLAQHNQAIMTQAYWYAPTNEIMHNVDENDTYNFFS